jgi:hypothetical protein
MACADGSVATTKVVWTSWGPAEAKGHGVVTADDCAPDCAKGKSQYFPAAFLLTDQRDGRFLRLTVSYPGLRPYEGEALWGDKTHSYPLVGANGE